MDVHPGGVQYGAIFRKVTSIASLGWKVHLKRLGLERLSWEIQLGTLLERTLNKQSV